MNVIVYQLIPIDVLVIMYVLETVLVIHHPVLQIVQEVIVGPKELVLVIIIVEKMGIAVLINIHAHATLKLQEILLVHAILKLVLAIHQCVMLTVL